MSAAVLAERELRPTRPLDLSATLSPLRRGHGDPAVRAVAGSGWWWATRTREGTALLHLTMRAGGDHGLVRARAWGGGAQGVLENLPRLLGEDQDDASFVPASSHPALVAAHRAHPGVRVLRTTAVLEALAGAAIEQVVTGKEARSAWRSLLLAYGEPAPGPAGDAASPAAGMHVPPAPRAWAVIPTWEWLRAGVEERRRRVIQYAAHCAAGLERTTTMPIQNVEAALRTLPGVGVWTAAEVRQRAHGDADAFSFADYHIPKNVSWALTGQVLDDDGCAEVIERYRGHRYRVQQLIGLARIAPPRRGPHMSLPRHTPVATRGRS